MFNAATIDNTREIGAAAGYDAWYASVFVENPYAFNGPKALYDAWGDGYEVGVAKAKLEDRLATFGMSLPANDDEG